MITLIFRTLLVYIFLIVIMRLMGKRQLGELQPSELVITFLISNIATLPIEDNDLPLMSGAVPILTLMCFEVILSWIGMKNRRLRTMLSGTPRIIIRDGKINQKERNTLCTKNMNLPYPPAMLQTICSICFLRKSVSRHGESSGWRWRGLSISSACPSRRSR